MKNKLIHFVAVTLIACIGITDLLLYTSYVQRIESTACKDAVVYEEHELAKANADGVFDGDGTDSAVGGEGEYESNTGKKRSYNILEIVPDKRMALIGYSIAGCEPVSQADLDAMVNTEPGSSSYPYVSAPSFNGVQIGGLAMNKGKTAAMYYYPEHMNGYYEYVGKDKGVYSFVEVLDSEDGYVKDVKMRSKYYNNSKSGNDYIWVEDNSLKSFGEESDDHKTKETEVSSGKNSGEKIYVYNHHKNKYVNNELFLCLMSDFIGGIDHSVGVYSGGNQYNPWNPSPKVSKNDNYELVEKWRETNTVTVMTKDPQNITCKDVDNADFIIINNTITDGSYDVAYKIMSYVLDDYSGLNSNFGGENDISVDVMKRIYKHVVVDNDVAIAVSQHVANSPSDTYTNAARLGCMLFFIQNKNVDSHLENGDTVCGTGRDFFKNLLFDYGMATGSSDRDINYEVDVIDGVPVTDYLYINDAGELISNGGPTISMPYWNLDDRVFKEEWLWNEALESFYYDGYIDYWRNNNHTQIDCKGLGFYSLSNSGTLTNNGFGKYKNQIFYSENHNLFSDLSNGAEAIRSINSNVDHRTEHFVDTDVKTKKSYFLSMNIVNGDSMTPELKKGEFDINRNKTLYVNKYEVNDIIELPINIEIVTSNPITKIAVTKTNRDGTVTKKILGEYLLPSGVLKGGGNLGAVSLSDEETDYGEDGKPKDCKKVNDVIDYYKYTLTGTIKLEMDELKEPSGNMMPNNTIMIEVTNDVNKSERDLITIVTRDFFMLN